MANGEPCGKIIGERGCESEEPGFIAVKGWLKMAPAYGGMGGLLR